ncbi:proteasome accessory factor A [Dietzia kunjamensis subsp. schimae]|uniref:Pup--protein ligase n=1 Tax=Dietzia kunjamensis subsp. schimae TaxID=498198 RepID=A0ABY1N476_9ACTN|nr:Pup--protein ligase [Dietzia kunjamensis]MBB1015561.1 Pup--protein ligase [Dietzia kunjamensis subsp. schimae]SMO85121.1 proteasome accessory factor A [Dietzia kunjamensis subsp. schimae]
MIRRIVGIETEFGITSVGGDGARSLGADEIARYFFRPVVQRWRSSNVFLENGSRLYLDVGSHPEYATAECDGLRQLVAHDRAGERIVDDLALQAEQALAAEGIDVNVYLFKNNTDSVGNSYGCHENYLLDRATQVRSIATTLLPFLVSRQLLCGAGKILPGTPAGVGLGETEEPTFCFSQRAEHMWDGVSSATTRSRPLINTRDEPHADSTRFRRMHVIVGDSNMIETTTLLKIASTRLVLEMLEAGVELRPMAVAHPVRAIREISRDLTGTRPVAMTDGTTMTALEIQREFLAAVQRYLDSGGWERDDRPDIERCVALWERVLDAVESGDHESIAADIDWAAKLRLIRQVQAKTGVDLDHPRLSQIDLTYHDVRPGRGLHSVLERRGLVSRVVDDAEVERARTVAPETTRAALRGRFITAARDAERDFTVDWVHLKVSDGTLPTVALTDPFAHEDPRVDELVAALGR